MKLSGLSLWGSERSLYVVGVSLYVVGAEVSDLDSHAWTGLIESLEKRGSRIRQGIKSEEEVLERLHVIDSESRPILAGMLALGYYPQQFYPQLYIDVAVHPTKEKSADTTRFLDRAHCDGPLPLAVEDAIKVILRNLRTRTVEHGSTMVDEPEIPEIALREAVVNAVTPTAPQTSRMRKYRLPR